MYTKSRGYKMLVVAVVCVSVCVRERGVRVGDGRGRKILHGVL